MTGWWGQLAGSFPASRGLSVCLSMNKLGRTWNQDSRNTSFVRQRATKIWAQLVDSTTQHVLFKTKQSRNTKTWPSHSQPSRGAAVPRIFLITSLQAFSKYLVVYVYLNGSMLLVPSP